MTEGENKKPRPRPRPRGSLFGPLLLVLIGILLLAYNLGGWSGSAWDVIWRLWPLLFVAGALDSLWRREGLVLPVLGLSLGVVFLLANFSLLAINAWLLLFRLWPVFLVAIGLDLVLGRRSIWGGLAALVLLAAIIAGMLWYFGSDLTAGRLLTDKISQSMEGAEQARITLNPAIGTVSIKALVDSRLLLEGEILHTSREKVGVASSYDLNEGTAVYSLRSTGFEVFYPTGPRASPSWKLSLSDRLPLDVTVELGAGELDLDFSRLQVQSLKVDLGVGKMVVTLPESVQGLVQIEGAIGETQIIVPKGAAVRVHSSTGIGNVVVPSSYLSQEGSFVSSNFASAEKQIDLNVDQAIGRVLIIER